VFGTVGHGSGFERCAFGQLLAGNARTPQVGPAQVGALGSAPFRLAPVRSVSLRSALRKLAPPRLAPRRLAPVNIASLKLVSVSRRRSNRWRNLLGRNLRLLKSLFDRLCKLHLSGSDQDADERHGEDDPQSPRRNHTTGKYCGSSGSRCVEHMLLLPERGRRSVKNLREK